MARVPTLSRRVCHTAEHPHGDGLVLPPRMSVPSPGGPSSLVRLRDAPGGRPGRRRRTAVSAPRVWRRPAARGRPSLVIAPRPDYDTAESRTVYRPGPRRGGRAEAGTERRVRASRQAGRDTERPETRRAREGPRHPRCTRPCTRLPGDCRRDSLCHAKLELHSFKLHGRALDRGAEQYYSSPLVVLSTTIATIQLCTVDGRSAGRQACAESPRY